MKKLFAIMLAVSTLASCSSRPEAIIDGTVTGVEDGTKVYLLDYYKTPLDSTLVAGGKFRFEIAKAYPDRRMVVFDGLSTRYFMFYVEPGTIVVDIDPEAWVTSYKGTPTNDAHKALSELQRDLARRQSELVDLIWPLQEVGGAVFDSLYALYKSVDSERRQNINDAIAANPDSFFAVTIIGADLNSLETPAMVDSVLAVVANAPANGFTDRLKERCDILVGTAVGFPAPEFTQNQPDGTPFSLSSLKGKLVLIDFWASWCGPCRAENPHVKKVYEKYHDQGFEIVGVSLDDDREAWLKAIEDDGLGWIHVSDLGGWQNAVAKQYSVLSIPYTVMIGPDGTIVAKNLRGPALEEKVSEQINQIKPH